MLWRKLYYLAIALAISNLGILPVVAIEPTPLSIVNHSPKVEQLFTTFPCGLNIGRRQILPSMMIRGKEDGEKAIDFNNWSIPFNVLTRTLKIQTKTFPDGSIELRSSAAVARIDAKELNSYPEIGLEIKTPEQFNFKAIEPKFNFNTSNGSEQSQRQIRAAGTLFGSSWYVQLGGDADRLLDLRLDDAQIVKYSDRQDYIIGGQSAFWNRQNSGNYSGITGIWRQGFTPQLSPSGSVSTSERIQASKVGRSIFGKASPGTLVQLLSIDTDRAIAEVLVDGTGIFRFDNIPVTDDDRYYRLWLFPNGQLSAAPEIRSVNFVTVPGQLPTGATATLASVGLRQETGGFGKFGDVRGAVVTHWGVSEWLTLGSGVSLDRGIQGLGELYIQPNGIPLEAAISLRTGPEWDLLSNINWQPTTDLKFSWNIDRLSHRVRSDWKLSPEFSLNSTYDSRDALGAGFSYTTRKADLATSLQASFDTNSRLRWRLGQQLGAWDLQHQGNEVGTISHLSYAFRSTDPKNKTRQTNTGSSIQLSYQTSQLNKANEFTTLAWRYRPTNRFSQGEAPPTTWEAELGYGIGNAGGGWIASSGINILPGVTLRGRYQTGINSTSPSFSLEIVANLETKDGLRGNPQELDVFRTHGGIEIVPFFDRNGNGEVDAGEKLYIDLELINLNNRPLKPYRPVVEKDRISVGLAPGKYRLDFDPSGFPADWRTKSTGYAVEVAAGSYTKVLVPLMPSYSIEGIVRDRQGKPLVGAKVELIPTPAGERIFSITNADGQFYLESLSQGSYQLQVNNKSISPATVNLNSSSQTTQTVTTQAEE
jgi:Carboxypeptidase regulatory-like domain